MINKNNQTSQGFVKNQQLFLFMCSLLLLFLLLLLLLLLKSLHFNTRLAVKCSLLFGFMYLVIGRKKSLNNRKMIKADSRAILQGYKTNCNRGSHFSKRLKTKKTKKKTKPHHYNYDDSINNNKRSMLLINMPSVWLD